MLSLWCDIPIWAAGDLLLEGYGGIEIPKSPWRLGGSTYPRVLPLRPIWLGFAVNTAFYAVVIWLLSGGTFKVRRSIRKKRGLCPKCAYPVGDSSVCTECGRELAT